MTTKESAAEAPGGSMSYHRRDVGERGRVNLPVITAAVEMAAI